MILSYFLFFLLICYGILIIWLLNRIYYHKNRIKQLEKWLYSDTTDFEKLSQIVELYSLIDFDKLRPDHVKLWMEWLENNKKTLNLYNGQFRQDTENQG